jgi:hypothetical protein
LKNNNKKHQDENRNRNWSLSVPQFLIRNSRFVIGICSLLVTITFPLHATTPGFDTLVNYDTAWTYVYDGGLQADSSVINDNFYDVKVFPDGSSYCVGGTLDSANMKLTLLIKLNSSGQMLWKKTYEKASSGHSIIQANNGSIIIGGEIALSPMVMSLDTAGNKLWTTWYYDSVNNETLLSRNATINYFRETSRGTIVCTAGDPYPNNGGNTLNNYAAFLEFNSTTGALKRHREWENVSGYEIGGFSVEETKGGQYMLGGNQAVFYLDSLGRPEWQTEYTFQLNGVGSEINNIYRVKVLRDNTPMVMGQAYEGNCWTKYSKLYYDAWWSPIGYASGLNANWDTAGEQGSDDKLLDFTQLSNGNLVFVGNHSGGNGVTPIWIIVTDSIGKKQYFEKEFRLPTEPGLNANTFPMSVVATPDSGFTLVGWGYTDTSTGKNAFAIHFVHKDPTAAVKARDKTNARTRNSIKTNICRSRLTVECNEFLNSKSKVSVFDLTGRCLAMKTGNNKIVMDISHISQGTYLLKVKTNNSTRTQKIFIKN